MRHGDETLEVGIGELVPHAHRDEGAPGHAIVVTKEKEVGAGPGRVPDQFHHPVGQAVQKGGYLLRIVVEAQHERLHAHDIVAEQLLEAQDLAGDAHVGMCLAEPGHRGELGIGDGWQLEPGQVARVGDDGLEGKDIDTGQAHGNVQGSLEGEPAPSLPHRRRKGRRAGQRGRLDRDVGPELQGILPVPVLLEQEGQAAGPLATIKLALGPEPLPQAPGKPRDRRALGGLDLGDHAAGGVGVEPVKDGSAVHGQSLERCQNAFPGSHCLGHGFPLLAAVTVGTGDVLGPSYHKCREETTGGVRVPAIPNVTRCKPDSAYHSAWSARSPFGPRGYPSRRRTTPALRAGASVALIPLALPS